MSLVPFTAENNSRQTSGVSADGPAANTVIVNLSGSSNEGIYEIEAYVEQVGTPIAADLANLSLQVGGSTIYVMLANAPAIKIRRRVNAGQAVRIQTGAGATAAGTRYAATLVITRVA